MSPLGNDAAKRYGFGGKELQSENISGNILDWYDFHARNYDPALGRWMNIDPVADVEPSLTPFRYAFNNPLSFVDPDGMYEWRINTETGEYEKIGDEGGDKNQHIYLNDGDEAAFSMQGSNIYVGAVRPNWYADGEVSFAVSTVDVWEDLPDEYEGAYTMHDLRERYLAKKEGGDKYNRIRSQEEQGLARKDQVWSLRDEYYKVYETQGSVSGLAVASYTGMLQEIVGMMHVPTFTASSRENSGFSPKFTARPSQLSSNPWIKFLQTNKGIYKGKGLGKSWIREAAKDYKALKKAGKL